jgi:hypothetical protein
MSEYTDNLFEKLWKSATGKFFKDNIKIDGELSGQPDEDEGKPYLKEAWDEIIVPEFEQKN